MHDAAGSMTAFLMYDISANNYDRQNMLVVVPSVLLATTVKVFKLNKIVASHITGRNSIFSGIS